MLSWFQRTHRHHFDHVSSPSSTTRTRRRSIVAFLMLVVSHHCCGFCSVRVNPTTATTISGIRGPTRFMTSGEKRRTSSFESSARVNPSNKRRRNNNNRRKSLFRLSSLASKRPSVREEEEKGETQQKTRLADSDNNAAVANENEKTPPLLTDNNGNEFQQVGSTNTKTNTNTTIKTPSQNQQFIEQQQPQASMAEISRRKWLAQFGVMVGGGALLAGNTNTIRQPPGEEKAFIRLEPYANRQKPSSVVTTKSLSYTNLTTPMSSKNNANATSIATTKSPKNGTSPSTTRVTSTSNSSSGAKSKSTNAATTTSSKTRANMSNETAATTTSNKELAPVNFTKVVAENSINITLKDCKGGCVRVNGTSFQKIQTPPEQFPWFWPTIFFKPPAPKIIKDIPDTEILLAATVAGSIIEMGRTTLLYPLSTVKTRIQTRQQEQQRIRWRRRRRFQFQRMERFHTNSSLRIHHHHHHHNYHNSNNNNETVSLLSASHNDKKTSSHPQQQQKKNVTNNKLRFRRRLRVLYLIIRRHVAEGNLYAGLVPSLLVSVPATGVYYGVRDVTKRALNIAPAVSLDDAAITLLGALVGDVASLMIRTPADALAARLQAVAASTNANAAPNIPKDTATTTTAKIISNSKNLYTGTKADQNSDVHPVVRSNKVSDSLQVVGNVTMLGTDGANFSSPKAPARSQDGLGIMTGKNNVSELLEAMALDEAEEVLFHEEEEHYKKKETTLLIHDNHTADRLLAAVLPDEYDHKDQFLLLQLQRREVNIDDLFNRVSGSTTPSMVSYNDLTAKQRKRLQRKTKKTQRKLEKKRALGRHAEARAKEMETIHFYTLEFLEALKEEEKFMNIPIDKEVDKILNGTVQVDWDDTIKKLQNQLTLFMMNEKATKDNLTNEKNNQTSTSELEKGNTIGGAANETVTSTRGLMGQEDDNDAAIRMQEREEKQLLQELQEESVYQEDWLRQSLQRLPAIIITDLPYLLSRIALNRVVIHGKVNIGQYEVATIAIAMLCAFLTTPFDVVRTRLLVENESPSTEVTNDEIGSANDKTFISNGNVILVNATAESDLPFLSQKDYLNQGVLETMIAITKEGDGGARNLYAGWLERTVYFGIGRAWLDPINIITYVGIRDALLLRWFD